jgi:hypothetical protein
LQVAIDLNIGQAQVTQYYSDYLKLIGLDDITKLYIEFKGDVMSSVPVITNVGIVMLDRLFQTPLHLLVAFKPTLKAFF